jgi:hypothetical protein
VFATYESHKQDRRARRRRLADADQTETKFLDLVNWMERYGFDGGDPDGMGESIFTGSLSYSSFFNHDCNHNPAVRYMRGDYADILKGGTWDPVSAKYRTELQFIEYFVRDVQVGEIILDDYTKWQQVHFGVTTDELTSWCGSAA